MALNGNSIFGGEPYPAPAKAVPSLRNLSVGIGVLVVVSIIGVIVPGPA